MARAATKMPDGIVVELVPAPFVETKSGPQTALTATTIHMTVIARDATCLVFDRIARPDAASVEAALERKFPGAWSRSGDVWAVNGARPMTVRLTSTAGGAGIAVETVN